MKVSGFLSENKQRNIVSGFSELDLEFFKQDPLQVNISKQVWNVRVANKAILFKNIDYTFMTKTEAVYIINTECTQAPNLKNTIIYTF